MGIGESLAKMEAKMATGVYVATEVWIAKRSTYSATFLNWQLMETGVMWKLELCGNKRPR